MTNENQQKKAGIARASGMSPEERKSLATKAAHAKWKRDADGLAIAVFEGSVPIGDGSLPCAVLKDGRRIFSERAVADELEHIRSGSEFKKRREQDDGKRLPVYINAVIAQFLSPESKKKLESPIRYKGLGGIPGWGIEAELLPEICDAFLSARSAGVLTKPSEMRKAAAAERLIRSFAKVGVIALIDEVTGYQVVRDKDELQRLLEKYVSEEFRPWISVFPNEFYVELFRLRRMTTSDVRKRPPYFGKITNDIVYNRLVPGVLPKLDEVNPTNEKGRRKRTHHQHLREQGEAHLRAHLSNLVFLMRGSTSWDNFMESLNRAAPRHDVET